MFSGSLDLLLESMHHRETREKKKRFSIWFLGPCPNTVNLACQLTSIVVILICVLYGFYLELDSLCKLRYCSKVCGF